MDSGQLLNNIFHTRMRFMILQSPNSMAQYHNQYVYIIDVSATDNKAKYNNLNLDLQNIVGDSDIYLLLHEMYRKGRRGSDLNLKK